MSPLISADLPDGPGMRTISASNPSSLKKPFCCASGKTIQWTTCCGTPTLILSAAAAAPLAINHIVTAATTSLFICPPLQSHRSNRTKGNAARQAVRKGASFDTLGLVETPKPRPQDV